MSRTIGAALATHLATGATRLADCVRLDLRDGTTIGITTHDVDVSVNLGDGAITYKADTGALPSAIVLALGLSADNYEVRGPIGSLVTRAAVLGGRFHRARARRFHVNVGDTSQYMKMLNGKVTQTRVEGGEFVFEVRSSSDAYNQSIGRVMSPYCSHDFGVGQCQKVPATYAATVVAAADDMTVEVSFTSSPAPSAADVRNGLCTFLTGALAGTLPVEIFDYDAGSHIVTLYQPLAAVPAVGATLELEEGCDKLRATCKAKGQILNFGGFPDVRGTDSYLEVPIPGA